MESEIQEQIEKLCHSISHIRTLKETLYNNELKEVDALDERLKEHKEIINSTMYLETVLPDLAVSDSEAETRPQIYISLLTKVSLAAAHCSVTAQKILADWDRHREIKGLNENSRDILWQMIDNAGEISKRAKSLKTAFREELELKAVFKETRSGGKYLDTNGHPRPYSVALLGHHGFKFKDGCIYIVSYGSGIRLYLDIDDTFNFKPRAVTLKTDEDKTAFPNWGRFNYQTRFTTEFITGFIETVAGQKINISPDSIQGNDCTPLYNEMNKILSEISLKDNISEVYRFIHSFSPNYNRQGLFIGNYYLSIHQSPTNKAVTLSLLKDGEIVARIKRERLQNVHQALEFIIPKICQAFEIENTGNSYENLKKIAAINLDGYSPPQLYQLLQEICPNSVPHPKSTLVPGTEVYADSRIEAELLALLALWHPLQEGGNIHCGYQKTWDFYYNSQGKNSRASTLQDQINHGISIELHPSVKIWGKTFDEDMKAKLDRAPVGKVFAAENLKELLENIVYDKPWFVHPNYQDTFHPTEKLFPSATNAMLEDKTPEQALEILLGVARKIRNQVKNQTVSSGIAER